MNTIGFARLGTLAFAAALVGPATAQQVTMMTGPQGGSWVPLGGALKHRRHVDSSRLVRYAHLGKTTLER